MNYVIHHATPSLEMIFENKNKCMLVLPIEHFPVSRMLFFCVSHPNASRNTIEDATFSHYFINPTFILK